MKKGTNSNLFPKDRNFVVVDSTDLGRLLGGKVQLVQRHVAIGMSREPEREVRAAGRRLRVVCVSCHVFSSQKNNEQLTGSRDNGGAFMLGGVA